MLRLIEKAVKPRTQVRLRTLHPFSLLYLFAFCILGDALSAPAGSFFSPTIRLFLGYFPTAQVGGHTGPSPCGSFD